MRGELKRLGRRVLGGALMLASTAGSGTAEGWQADAVPVSAAEVQAVLDSLDRIEAAARAAGQSFAGAQGGRLSETVPRVAGEYGLDGGLPDRTVRVLAAYDALRQGVVNTRGGWSPGADFGKWSEVLFIGDVPVVAARMDDFGARQPFFTGGMR